MLLPARGLGINLGEGWGIGKLVMFMFGVIILLFCRTNRREMREFELQFGSSGKTIVLPQTFHKHISQKIHTYLTLREEYNNNWTQRRGGEKHNKHP